MSKTYYNIEYNPVSETWCLFKYIEGNQSMNFYPIVQSKSKKDCQIKLDEINAKIIETEKNRKKSKGQKGFRAIYELYSEGKLIDTDTKENLLKKYKDLGINLFQGYIYKKGYKYTYKRIK